ncbi:MAG: hypothetical protein LBM60_03130 [Clostridium sp.]|jgi:hypothetical protein|nr:hypothetical protein [Clostridium sp.]
METFEIILLVGGAICLLISFFLPIGQTADEALSKDFLQEEVKKTLEREADQMRSHVEGVTEEAIEYSMEKTQRSLERISNEKIMAVSEYADTVLAQIEQNHKEVLFLYDLLNDKQKSLKISVAQMQRSVKEAQNQEQVSTSSVAGNSDATSNNRTKPLLEIEKIRQTTGASTPTNVDALSQSHRTARTNSAVDMNALNLANQTSKTNDSASIDEGESRNQNEKIVTLYREGKSYVEIAKELGLGVGEVKLVIDLTKNVIAHVRGER